jgi:DNA-binding NarL/FixJ family response regulator
VRQPKPVAPRVYIVSEVRLYWEGLISSLARQSDLEILGAGSSGDAIERIISLQPEVLLLDLSVRDSLALSRRARELVPALRVVAFAVEEQEENILACARAGICGYLAQDGSVEDVVAAVRRALNGELLCSPRIAAFLFSRIAAFPDAHAGPPVDVLLTRREREIAALLACDLPNKEIARRLHLGPATIKNHVHNILQKLNLRHRGDVARLQLNQIYGASPEPATRHSAPRARPDPLALTGCGSPGANPISGQEATSPSGPDRSGS